MISSRSSVISSLPGFSAPQRLFRPSGFISIWLFCSTGIISAVQIHLYLALFLHRDYFNRPDSSLSGSFAPQGLFRSPKFISIWLFCSTEIISTARIHLYLDLLLHRDYFSRPDSSLSSSFAPQGLLCPGLMHLHLALLFHRDYFGRPDSSLSGSFAPQGLFQPPRFISIWIFCSTRIISAARIHLYLALLPHKDYFAPVGFISIWLFCSTGIILPRSDASLSGSFAPQGLFRPPRFISIWLFCSTGIISAARIHLYLALLPHRDYFGRPDSSLSGSFVPEGLFQT